MFLLIVFMFVEHKVSLFSVKVQFVFMQLKNDVCIY